MERMKKLAALLLALCLTLGLTACAMDKEDAALLDELLSEALQEAEDAAPADQLVLVEGPGAPAGTEAPAPEEPPEGVEAPAPTQLPEETGAPAETEPPEETGAPAETEPPEETEAPAETEPPEEPVPDPDGEYTSKEDVALYLHLYGELPKNFMTKSEARALGWSGGGLDDFAYGMCIGGDRFGNYEGLLPDGSYRECDIDTLHARSRGAKRLIYSDDGRVYYTGDHYESFTLLYGEE